MINVAETLIVISIGLSARDRGVAGAGVTVERGAESARGIVIETLRFAQICTNPRVI